MATNGFKNYETYLVNLWLHNDEPNYLLLREVMETYSEDCIRAHYLEWVISNLIDARDFQNGLWPDLISAALSKVDWLDIVGSY